MLKCAAFSDDAPVAIPIPSELLLRELPGRRDLLALAAREAARYPCLLESAAANDTTGTHDLLFRHDGDALIQRVREPRARFLDRLDRAWRDVALPRGDARLPFRGGFVVQLGYELAAECEPRLELPAPPAPFPLGIALRCPAAILYDHRRDVTILVAEPDRADLLESMHADLERGAPAVEPARVGAAPIEEDPQRFLDGVARIHEYLRDGHVFQVNLSRRWEVPVAPEVTPAALYAALRRANPAPFAGLMQFDGRAVLSSSPERLMRVAGERIETRPIAGTRPRLAGDDERARIRELIAHPKERAEHIMLIDLERNDLGRVAVPGSVTVDELMAIESYAHVHHIVSNVRARLRAGVTPGQAIRAVFPGGTITGCPKVRCMEIIAELEGEGRGPYTGALGYLNRDGDLDLNILIRTIWLQDGVARVRAGSGIVADSDPQRELAETRAKARGMLRALGAED